MTTTLRKPNDEAQEHPSSASTFSKKQKETEDSPDHTSRINSSIEQAASQKPSSNVLQPSNLSVMPEPHEFKQAPMTLIGSNQKSKVNKKGAASAESRLDYVCEALGFVKAQLHTIQVIDFCLDDICRLDWISYFPSLKELICVTQGISEIESIDKCKLVERIWLNNNQIEHIKLFDRLPMLKHLFLGSNKISKIRGLEKCVQLEKLWLDDNRIEQIEGLQNLILLVELNMAQNNIEVIGIGLDGLISLRELNLSANRIGNFKEVLNLNRLPNLSSCNFIDPHYGENPICSLCNYQTYVLFHLPKLQKLDTLQVSEESKSFAETTFMKKRMYYNMRIKTIQRNTSNIMKLLKICRKVRICKLDIQTSKLIKKLHEINRELEERQYLNQNNRDQFESMFTYGHEHSTLNPLDKIDNAQLVSDIENKRALIQGRMHDKNEDLKDLETIFEALRRKIYEMSEQNIHRLMTELETGGNIRFEEGRPQDRWFSSCVDLVRSRFSAEQMKTYGIIGINVTRVTRIHNRFLRNRFEEKLEQLVDLSDNQYKRSLEYLFYGVNPSAPTEIFRAMEEGFRSIQEYHEAGLPHCVSLVNGVASAEIARINSFLKAEDGYAYIRSAAKAQKQTEYRGNTDLTIERGLVQIPSGQLLVCKIFLQKCTHDLHNPYFNPSSSASEIWKAAPVDVKQHSQVQSVYRIKETDPKQRMWFVLDHALALPEYLVEFDYITNPKSVAENRRLSEQSVINEECNALFKGISQTQRVLENNSLRYAKETAKLQTISLTAQDLDRSDMGCLKRSLHSFMNTCHIQELMDNNYEFVEDEKTGQAAIENSMPPEIPLRSQLDHITPQIIMNISRERNTEAIIYLNLFNNKIKKIECFQSLVNLQTLILSFNEIEELDGLSKNQALKKLDLNHNFIKIIQNLESQRNLTYLDLRHNWINDLDQVDHIAENCPAMKELGLKCNPLANKKNYRINIFNKFQNLQKLDTQAITDKDKEQGDQMTKELTWDIIVDHLRAQKKNFQMDQQSTEDNDDTESKTGSQNNWERQVEELVLNHMQICKIQCLEKFINLRKLKLLDNNILAIQGLETLRVLEELSLEKNKLQGIQNLENLKYLKKLDLGSNKIKRIANVHMLVSLTQLSLENNEIQRLDGLEDLQCLMELYLGNNLISDVKETIKLKELQRLIILDISGNIMCQSKDQNYRIFCIFHLRKLRVLDGLSIDPTEHLEAKETFSGRLTEEILITRLQNKKLSDMRELDLSSCKLRDFEDMFDASTCPNLRDLNLSHNQMVSLKGLGFLPNLKILRLRDNKIETLFCKPSPDDKNFRRGLFGLPGLELLDVSQNQLVYLYGLQYSPLKELKMLFASGNEIVKIEHLEKLRQLRELDLSKNRIRQIDPNSFYSHHVIMCIRLDDNGLKSLANIEKLEKLQTLFVAGNRIQELFEIEKLAELPQLLELTLLQNPVARKPNYRMVVIKRLIQLLVFDGKEISQEERKRIEGSGGITDIKNQQPLVHFQQYPTVKVPVKLNPVNFDGVFNNMKFQMEGQTPTTVGQINNQGFKNMNNAQFIAQQNEIQNLLQVQSFQQQSQFNYGPAYDPRASQSEQYSQQFSRGPALQPEESKGALKRPSTKDVIQGSTVNRNQGSVQGISASTANLQQNQQFQYQMNMQMQMQVTGQPSGNTNFQQLPANRVLKTNKIGLPLPQQQSIATGTIRGGTISQIMSGQAPQNTGSASGNKQIIFNPKK